MAISGGCNPLIRGFESLLPLQSLVAKTIFISFLLLSQIALADRQNDDGLVKELRDFFPDNSICVFDNTEPSHTEIKCYFTRDTTVMHMAYAVYLHKDFCRLYVESIVSMKMKSCKQITDTLIDYKEK